MDMRIAAAALAALVGGCGVSGGISPVDIPKFPSQANAEIIWAEAVFYTNHDDLFRKDLVSADILPIGLKVGLRGKDAITRRLGDDTFDAHLYLEDGTVLDWVPYDKVAVGKREVAARVTEHALNLSLLADWDAAPAGFVFFRVGRGEDIDGTKVSVGEGAGKRKLDLLRSLVTFTVATDEGPRRVNVGLKSGIFPVRDD